MASRLRSIPSQLSRSVRTPLNPQITSRFARPFSTSLSHRQAATDPEENPSRQREAQKDREKINTEANEYSKSGTDADAAAQEDAAFNPKKSSSDPQEAKKVAGQGQNVNPLDASPANPELSQGTSETDQTDQNTQTSKRSS